MKPSLGNVFFVTSVKTELRRALGALQDEWLIIFTVAEWKNSVRGLLRHTISLTPPSRNFTESLAVWFPEIWHNFDLIMKSIHLINEWMSLLCISACVDWQNKFGFLPRYIPAYIKVMAGWKGISLLFCPATIQVCWRSIWRTRSHICLGVSGTHHKYLFIHSFISAWRILQTYCSGCRTNPAGQIQFWLVRW